MSFCEHNTLQIYVSVIDFAIANIQFYNSMLSNEFPNFLSDKATFVVLPRLLLGKLISWQILFLLSLCWKPSTKMDMVPYATKQLTLSPEIYLNHLRDLHRDSISVPLSAFTAEGQFSPFPRSASCVLHARREQFPLGTFQSFWKGGIPSVLIEFAASHRFLFLSSPPIAKIWFGKVEPEIIALCSCETAPDKLSVPCRGAFSVVNSLLATTTCAILH